jgi:hypothetical protein
VIKKIIAAAALVTLAAPVSADEDNVEAVI